MPTGLTPFVGTQTEAFLPLSVTISHVSGPLRLVKLHAFMNCLRKGRGFNRAYSIPCILTS